MKPLNKYFSLFGALLFVGFTISTQAQTYQTWRGEATSGSWQGSQNWWNFPNGSPIVFGQQEWNNNHYTSQTNDNGGNTFNTWRWVFQGGANSAHTFTGDAVRFFDSGGSDPAIINQSSATHNINLAVNGDGDSGDPLKIQIDNNSGGGLSFGSTVNNQGSDIHVVGTATAAATVTFNGVISGTAGFYKENSNLTVEMKAANTYSGQTTIQAGTIRLSSSGSLASSNVRLHSGGSLDVTVNATVNSVAEYANGNAGTVSIGSGAVLTIDGADQGTLFQNSITGSGGLTMGGSGNTTVSLYGTQSYSGATTVTGGKLSTSVALSSGSFNLNGGTLETQGANQISDTASITLGGGTLSIGGTETFGNNGIALSSSTSSTISVTNGITASVSGAATGSGNFSKSGSGQLNLSGDNSFSGTTTVTAGSLEIQSANALGSTAAGTTVNSGAELRLWHASGVTVAAEGLTLNGDGIGGNGSLRNISGNNTWQGAISNNNGARINSDAGLLTISGNISNASGQTLYFGGAGNTAVSGQITGSKTTGDGTLFKNGAGTLTLSGNNSSSLTGTMVLRAGTVSVANANSLGSSGTIIIGTSGSANAVTLNVSDTTTRAGSLTVENTSTGGVVEVASGKTFTISGVLDQNGGTSLDTRFEKRGAGTLKLSGGTTGTFNGQIRISDGTLVAGSNGSLGDNVSTGTRALDLGINLSATASDKNVRIDLANGVNLNQSIYVGANQNSATRTLGMEGGAGSGTFQNEIYMDGALTLDPGASGTLTVSGKLTQNQSGASQAITKTGAGTVILSGANDFKGGVNLNQGVLRLDTTTAAGTGTITQSSGASTLEVNTTGTVANQMSIYNVKTLQNVTLSGNKTLNNATYDVAASTTTTESGALSGSGGITKNGAGTLVVSGSSANTFTGASAVNAGTLKLEKTGGASAISGTSIAINGGTLLLGAANQIANSTTVTLNGGILETAGHADAVGKLTVSGASTIKGLNDTSGSAFTFSDIDLSNYSTSSGSALTFVNSAGGNYSLGTVFQISTVAANSWTGYSETSLNNFSQKIQFGNGNVGQISFGSGISGTTLTVAAIPDARVYSAAAFLLVLIGLTEYRRRRKTVSSKG